MTILPLILIEIDGEKIWHNGSMFSEYRFCGNMFKWSIMKSKETL